MGLIAPTRAIVLNLDADVDRLYRITGRLQALRLSFTRLPAQPRSSFAERGARAGYFACAASHRAALKQTAANGLESPILVVEDDAVFRDDTVGQVAAMMKFLPRDQWDVFYLGCRVDRGCPAGTGVPLTVVNGGFHTHAYVAHPRAIPALTTYIDDAIRTNRPFDTFTPFRRFRAAPVLAVQEPGVSSSEGRIMWRLQEYFTLAAQEEFYVHCRELRERIAHPALPTAAQEKLLGDGARHQRAGQPERAEAICDQLLATDPAHAPALRLLGGILSARGDHQGLKARLLTALAYRPAGEFYFGLGLLAVRLGYLTRAAEAFMIAVHRDAAAGAPRAHLGRVLIQLAAAIPDPPDCFRALARRPDDPRALTAALLWAAGRPDICPGPDAAAVAYRAALQLTPGSVEACRSLADLLASRGDHVSAKPLYDRAAARQADSAPPPHAHSVFYAPPVPPD